MSPQSKIARALSTPRPEVDDLSPWAGVAFTAPQLAEKAEFVGKRIAYLKEVFASVESKVQAEKITIDRDTARLSMSPDLRRKTASESLANARRDHIKMSSDARTALLKELQQIESQVAAAQAAFWASPAHLAARHNLMSPERERAARTVATAGRATLEQYARLVVGDPSMPNRLEFAAALIERLSSMPRSERPVSPSAVANVVFGESWKLGKAQIDFVKAKVAEARAINRRFENPQTTMSGNTQDDSIAKIRAGLDRLQFKDRVNDDGTLKTEAVP